MSDKSEAPAGEAAQTQEADELSHFIELTPADLGIGTEAEDPDAETDGTAPQPEGTEGGRRTGSGSGRHAARRSRRRAGRSASAGKPEDGAEAAPPARAPEEGDAASEPEPAGRPGKLRIRKPKKKAASGSDSGGPEPIPVPERRRRDPEPRPAEAPVSPGQGTEQAGEQDEDDFSLMQNLRRPTVSGVITLILTVLLIAAAVLVVCFHDTLTPDALRQFFGRSTLSAGTGTAFSYENGASQTFALSGNGFAVASGTGIQLLDANGNTVAKETVSLDNPAVAASEQLAVFYDVGGTVCRCITSDGTASDLDPGSGVISVSVNESGYIAVITDISGSKGLISIYTPDCKLLFQWYSGSGYPLRALVGPDNKSAGILTVSAEGSTVHFFSLTSEQEQSSVSYADTICYDFYYMNSKTVCVISSDFIAFDPVDGSGGTRYDFGGRYLVGYDFGSTGFVPICLSEYRAGSEFTLLSFSDGGLQLGETDITGDFVGLSACGRQMLVVTSDALRLYARDCMLSGEAETLVTARQAFLRPRGDILLLSSYSGELYSIK